MAGKKKTTDSVDKDLSEDEKEQALFEATCKEYKSQSASKIKKGQDLLRAYSTGCPPLDFAAGDIDPITGLPGFQARSIVETFGPYSSLKTALAENIVISALNSDPDARVVMALPEEGDMARLEGRGADMDRIQVLAFYDPDIEIHWKNAETVLSALETFSKRHLVKACIIDSVAALTLQREAEDENGDQVDYAKQQRVGQHATLMQRFLKNFKQVNHSSLLWMTNQVRDYIPTNKFAMFEDKMRQRTPGGNAMRHYCDYRIDCYSKKHETEKEHPLLKKKMAEGLDFHFKMIKQKHARKYGDKIGMCPFFFDPPGFDQVSGILPFAEFFGKVERSGPAHYIINDQKFHGKDNLLHYLYSNPEYVEILMKELVELNKDEVYYGGEIRPSSKLR